MRALRSGDRHVYTATPRLVPTRVAYARTRARHATKAPVCARDARGRAPYADVRGSRRAPKHRGAAHVVTHTSLCVATPLSPAWRPPAGRRARVSSRPALTISPRSGAAHAPPGWGTGDSWARRPDAYLSRRAQATQRHAPLLYRATQRPVPLQPSVRRTAQLFRKSVRHPGLAVHNVDTEAMGPTESGPMAAQAAN